MQNQSERDLFQEKKFMVSLATSTTTNPTREWSICYYSQFTSTKCPSPVLEPQKTVW